MELTYAPMTPEDLPVVMEIERMVFSSPWTPGLFLHELRIPFSRLELARSGAKVIGYVCWWVVGDEVHILNLAIHPDQRRSGAGRALVQRVVDDALAHAARSISLEVREDNRPAQALYESLGFERAGLRRHYYGRGEDAVIMTRRFEEDAERTEA